MIADFLKYTWLYLLRPVLQRHGRQLLVLLFLVTSFVAWGDHQAWFRSPIRATHALEAFPDHTALLLDLPVDKKALASLKIAPYQTALWKISPLNDWQQELEQLQGLFEQIEGSTLWHKTNVVSGLQVTSSESVAWLHVLAGGQLRMTLKELVDALKPSHIERSTYRDHQIYTLTLGEMSWTVAEFRGLLLWSKATLLVESGIEQLDKIEGSVYHRSTHHQVAQQLDDKKLRLYLQWGNLVSLTNVVTYTNPRVFTGLRQIGEWSGWVLNTFEHGLQLQGITYPDADQAFLKALAQQKAPEKSRMVEILPNNFSALLYWGWSDVQTLYNTSTLTPNADFEQYFLPWLGQDIALVYDDLTDEEHAFAKNRLVFAHCTDSVLALSLLRKHAAELGDVKDVTYQNFQLHYLPSRAPLSPLLGDLINPLEQPYYTFIGDYAVFGDSKSTLEGWIQRFNNGDQLLKDTLYTPALTQLRSGSNIYALLNTPNATKFVQYLTRADQETNVLGAFEGLQQLYPIGVQWHGQGDYFALALSADYHPRSPKHKVKVASSWQADLEAEAVIAPQPIHSHDGNYYVVVQDANHKVYLLDKNGENRWPDNLVLSGTINSEIHPVDFYSNQQVQYAFSTETAIYIVSQMGEQLMTIPLIHRASSGVQVVDYGKGPRFFIACRNGAIYGYEEHGKPLSGWQPQKGVGRVPTPMAFLNYLDQRYFIAVTAAGTCRAYKRNGEPYFLKGRLGMGLVGWGIDPHLGRIAGCNKKGRIRVLNTKGKGFSLSPVEDLKPPIQFLYADVTGDARKDYLRLDGEQLAVHAYESVTDEKGKTKDELRPLGLFPIPGANNRVLFPIRLRNRSKAYIGYWDREQGSIGLLDAKGQQQRGFPLAGTSRFAVVDLFNEQGNTLVVANGNRVYTYKLK